MKEEPPAAQLGNPAELPSRVWRGLRSLGPLDRAIFDGVAPHLLARKAFIEFSVGVGEGRSLRVDVPVGEIERWRELTMRRIDVVVTWPHCEWVCEVKPRLTMCGIGQALCYGVLRIEDEKTTRRLERVVVCGEADEELIRCAMVYGVYVLVVSSGGPSEVRAVRWAWGSPNGW